MRQLTCEMCGGTDLVKDGGVFVCQTCGCKYSIEEARKMMTGEAGEPAAPVKVDNSGLIDNYLTLARNALESNNNAEAENYSNKVIELDPQNSAAWEIKGEAAGWQSKTVNNRMPEAVLAWLNAINFASDEERSDLRVRIAEKYVRLWAAMVSLRSENFGEIQSEDNLKSLLNDVDNGIEMMNTLTVKGGVSFNRASIYEKIANSMNSGAVDGYKDAKKDFGPEHRNMVKWQWNNFTASCDNCVSLLERAVELVRSSSLGKTICDNMVTIAEAARDSKSWKFNVNSWNSDNYDVDFTFTDAAKKIRTDAINKYKQKKKFFEAKWEREVLDALRSSRKKVGIDLARKQYWQEHQDEKARLDEEKANLQKRLDEIDKELKVLPIYAKIKATTDAKKAIEDKISALTAELKSLGLFKGKEKKAVQAKIDEQRAERDRVQAELFKLEGSVKDEKRPLEDEKSAVRKRISEIDAEFTKERGEASLEGQFLIPDAMVDGKLTVTPNGFLAHMQQILPEPYYIEALQKQDCKLHDAMGDTWSMIIKDRTISGDNKNTGLLIFVEADSCDDPIKTIVVQGTESEKMDNYRKFVSFGSLTLLSLCSDLSQNNAEQLIYNLKFDDSSALYGQSGLRVEYATYKQSLGGLLTLKYEGALIRLQD